MIAVIKIQGVELQALYDGQDTKLIKSFKIMYGSIRGRLVPFEDPVGTEKVCYMLFCMDLNVVYISFHGIWKVYSVRCSN